jgi:hypothetical protein
MAGLIMGASALCSAAVMHAGGWATLGVGATTSLALTGPVLDASLWRARGGLRLYGGFALAGMASNLLALAVRTGTKFVGLDHAAARPLASWLPQAVGTYIVCGLLAGWICAAVWFRYADGSPTRVGTRAAR